MPLSTPGGQSPAIIKAFVFDLDGTLVDTLDDIASVINAFLRSRSWPEHDRDAYRLLVGRGLRALIRDAVPASESHRVEEFYPEVFAVYDAMGIGNSRPYPGAIAALRTLSAAGAGLAVVSNKPDRITQTFVAGLFGDMRFALVRGGLDGVPSKPDPASALEAARACGVTPAECAFVGDSNIDMQAARAAGMLAVGAVWGFRGADELLQAGAMVLADSMADIPPLFGRSVARIG